MYNYAAINYKKKLDFISIVYLIDVIKLECEKMGAKLFSFTDTLQELNLVVKFEKDLTVMDIGNKIGVMFNNYLEELEESSIYVFHNEYDTYSKLGTNNSKYLFN